MVSVKGILPNTVQVVSLNVSLQVCGILTGYFKATLLSEPSADTFPPLCLSTKIEILVKFHIFIRIRVRVRINNK